MNIAPDEQQQPPPQPPGGVNLVPTAPPTNIFNPPQPQVPPEQQQVPPEEEEPPPSASIFSTPNASPAAEIVNPRVFTAFRAERSAEAGGGEAKRRTAAVRVWLEPDRPQVAAGDRLTVAVEAEAVRSVSHLPLTLTYDPAVLAFESAEAGDFLGGPGAAQVMADASHPGRLVLGASRLGEAPAVTGQGTVARLVFRVLKAANPGAAPGAIKIGFSEAQALDGALRPVLPLRTGAMTIAIEKEPPARRREG